MPLKIMINRRKALASYQDFSVKVVQEMCGFSCDAEAFRKWQATRSVIELLEKDLELTDSGKDEELEEYAPKLRKVMSE